MRLSHNFNIDNQKLNKRLHKLQVSSYQQGRIHLKMSVKIHLVMTLCRLKVEFFGIRRVIKIVFSLNSLQQQNVKLLTADIH